MININKILKEAIEKDASDIHLIAGIKPYLRVRRDLVDLEDFDELTEVDLGDSVQTIGSSAFEGCDKLEKVTIGENISSIGPSAFANNTKLVDIYFVKENNYSIVRLENYLKAMNVIDVYD